MTVLLTQPFMIAVFGLGTTELVLVLVAVLLVFGPSNLPKLAEAMGKSIRGFKKSVSEDEKVEERGGEEG